MGGIRLSAAEVARVADAQSLLLAPLDHPTFDAWRLAVVACLRDLVGADHGGFGYALDGRMSAVESDDASSTAMATYNARYWALDGALHRHLQDGASCRAVSRPMLWPERDVRRTEFWSDWVVPHRMHEPLAITKVSAERTRDGMPAEFAVVSLMRERPADWRHAERGVPLLALVTPAFAAGIALYRQVGRGGRALSAVVDAVPSGVLLADGAGRVLHVNAWLTRAVAADPQGAAVYRAAVRVAQACAVHSQSARGTLPARVTPAEEVGTRAGQYHVTGGLTEDAALAPARVVVAVTCTPLTVGSDRDAAPERVRRIFGLTPREAEVARLLARGLSNAQVAAALGVSPHTAARHTDRVLPKLGVHARAAVAHALRAAGDVGGPP
jgi:DNA-binding CsgD family transcriptional regulator/PAS domain-containing protein